MSSMDKVAKELYSAISKKDERTPKPYDTEATVVREEGDTIWVKIPGGIDETPVRKTINAKPGDNERCPGPQYGSRRKHRSN